MFLPVIEIILLVVFILLFVVLYEFLKSKVELLRLEIKLKQVKYIDSLSDIRYKFDEFEELFESDETVESV